MKVNIQIEGYDDIQIDDAKRLIIYDSDNQMTDFSLAKGVTKRRQATVTETIFSKDDMVKIENQKGSLL